MGWGMMRGLAVLCFAAALAAPAGALAQGPTRPAAADTVPAKKDLRQRALEKLRALEAASRPAPAADSGRAAPADSVRVPAADSTRVPAADSAVGRVPAGSPAAQQGAAPPGRAGTESLLPMVVHVPADSFMASLRELEGYTVTEYRAEKARYAADDGRLQLIGKPELDRQGEGMKADSLLSYDQRAAVICGYGKPLLEGTTGEPVASNQVCYNVENKVGVALGAKTKLTEGAAWFVHGDELYTSGTDRIYGAGTEFTSCDLEVPHYHFAAREMKIVHNSVMIARDVTLNFADVPVLWLPFMVQSLKQGRRSGLLAPSIGLQDIARTSSSYRRSIENVGFYWALNDYLGTQLWLNWRSGIRTELNGSLQYGWQKQFLNGSLTFGKNWNVDGSSSFSIHTGNSWRPGERTSVQVGGSYTSSARDLRRYSYDPQELNRNITSTASLNHRFDWGSLNLGAQRIESLSNGQVGLTLPSVSLSLTPVTLFKSAGEGSWYNNATWNGNMRFSSRRKSMGDELSPSATARDNGDLDAQASSSFSLGNFSWSQSVNFQEHVNHARPQIIVPSEADTLPPDTFAALPRTTSQGLTWSTSLGYTQRLIGTSTFSPSLSFGGGLQKPDTLAAPVAMPTRATFVASLGTNIYGFWPGVGPFGAFRHRVDPSLSYSYSPKPAVDSLQRAVFGAQVGKTNRLSLNLSQTIEAKYATTDTAPAPAPADTAPSADGAPRRLPQARKVTLLSLNTTIPAYDFERAEETGNWIDGFTGTGLSHTIRSELLRGLSLSVSHDIFRTETAAPGGAVTTTRSFAPRLRTVNTSFSLNSDSWLFRALGLAGKVVGGQAQQEADTAAADSAGEPGTSMIPGRASTGGVPETGGGRGAVGTWRANFDYSLIRPPAGDAVSKGNQQLRANISFQPTENWSVNWSTGYSISEREFDDHVLTLTRDLHRWQANFDFVKAQNGNFVFRFRVNLIDNPDIKLDYDQRSEGLGVPSGRSGIQ